MPPHGTPKRSRACDRPRQANERSDAREFREGRSVKPGFGGFSEWPELLRRVLANGQLPAALGRYLTNGGFCATIERSNGIRLDLDRR